MKKNVIILLIICVTMGACVPDSRELDQRSMIIGLGIDRGEEKLYKITIQLPILTDATSGPSGLGGRQYESFTVESDTIWDAFVQLETYTPSVLFFGHLKAVVLSEEVAREGLKEVVDLLDRESTVANQVYLVVVEGDASEFTQQESPLVTLPALYLDRFFEAEQKVARTNGIRLFKFLRDTNMISGASSIPLAHLQGEQIVVEGVGVFEDYRLKTKIREKEVGLSTLLKDDLVTDLNCTIVIEHEDVKVTTSLARSKLKQTIHFEETKPVSFHIDIKGTGEIVSLADVTVKDTDSFIKEVEKETEQYFEDKIHALIKRMQEENIEPWLMGHRIWAMNPEYFEQLNWLETGWKEAKFQINVEFEIDDTGQRGYYHKEKIGR
ncbi:Ger(x)C family spore germination protein [Alkalihalobacillus sp. LMS39]|uniref:Ger(x)C family spore germination protein n=1 Tax=Alkalihalobacillus sp. LMS39 TaxID=2924032 RepID=UPI001FB3ECBF|nr:Ger(x)C family spore germination protein [Alkalihalobacillus sp. LMS39]UOE94352.1 Ger(x)C family spore germination C-terminal domain-containing protein [Alkalihalobacillus sp. LMS39]